MKEEIKILEGSVRDSNYYGREAYSRKKRNKILRSLKTM